MSLRRSGRSGNGMRRRRRMRGVGGGGSDHKRLVLDRRENGRHVGVQRPRLALLCAGRIAGAARVRDRAGGDGGAGADAGRGCSSGRMRQRAGVGIGSAGGAGGGVSEAEGMRRRRLGRGGRRRHRLTSATAVTTPAQHSTAQPRNEQPRSPPSTGKMRIRIANRINPIPSRLIRHPTDRQTDMHSALQCCGAAVLTGGRGLSLSRYSMMWLTRRPTHQKGLSRAHQHRVLTAQWLHSGCTLHCRALTADG